MAAVKVGFYTNAITSLETIRLLKPAMIFYGANTCWWTHDRAHLCVKPGSGLPCDPRGGMLLQTDDVEGFLRSAEDSAEHYGEHGIRAFLAAHHQNCVVSRTNRASTCFPDWAEYNRILDEAAA